MIARNAMNALVSLAAVSMEVHHRASTAVIAPVVTALEKHGLLPPLIAEATREACAYHSMMAGFNARVSAMQARFLVAKIAENTNSKFWREQTDAIFRDTTEMALSRYVLLGPAVIGQYLLGNLTAKDITKVSILVFELINDDEKMAAHFKALGLRVPEAV